MSKKRGIVFCPYFKIESDGVYIPHVQMSKKQIRFFCLYWDYIIQPVRADIPRWKRSLDEIVLEEAKILTKDYEDIPEGVQESFVKENAYSIKTEGDNRKWLNVFLNNQYEALKRAQNLRNEVLWTPQQSFKEIMANPGQAFDIDAVQLELHKKLPVPSEDASIKKIVSYKYDNQDLFNEFKLSIDKLTNHVAKNGVENEYARNMALSDIEKIVKEIKLSSKRRWGKLVNFEGFRVQLSSAKISSLAKDFAKGNVTTGAVTNDPVSALFGGVLQASTNFISINPIRSRKLNCLPDDQIEFGYLTGIHRNELLKSM